MKLIPIKIFDRDGNVKYFGTDEDVLIPDTYEEKEEELRGVWVSTVANIDVPVMKLDDNGKVTKEEISKYKDYLLSIIKKVKEYHLNTVIFQVRPVNDALYESKMNPWSSVLTGVEGLYPGFDPFGFFVEEAKKENISVHAWINPYRAGRVDIFSIMKDDRPMTKEEWIATLAPNNFARVHPECTILTKQNKLLLDPANEMVREFVSDSIVEIASKYDIKAVHIDDYFYPYEYVNDELEEEKAKDSGFDKISDFRRHNVDLMIELIHNKLSKLPRKVEFGISPFGIYRTDSKYFNEDDKDNEKAWELGSNNAAGCTTNYANLYADVFKWMDEGWIDYVVPQDYFDLENSTIDENGNTKCLVKYADLVKWWSWAAKVTNCKLYIGQALYRVGSEGLWNNPEEIPNQLKYNNLYNNVSGTVFFTYKDFTNNERETLVKTRDILKTMWTKDVKDK